MKAAVLHGKETVHIQEVEAKALQPGEVRVQIKAALTCGTDLKVYRRGYHAKMIVPPAVFGHELAGIISEVCHPCGDWKPGERVVTANSAPCGTCFHCQAGQDNLCEDLLFLNGAYGESIVIPPRIVEKNLLRLAPGTGFPDAALTEPLACVVQGVQDLQIRSGERSLVIGSGPIGLMFVAIARSLGSHVTMAGRRAKRLELGEKLGAKNVIDVGGAGDLVNLIRNHCKDPFDVVFEAVGKPETWEASVSLVRKGGRVNFFGGCPAGTSVNLDTSLIHYSNLTLLASFHHTPRTIRKALQLIESGVITAADFVDAQCGLTHLPELFRQMAQGNSAVKTLIQVDR